MSDRLCFLDMDGVLADFVRGSLAFHKKELPYEEVCFDFWQKVDMTEGDYFGPLGEDFWASLEPTREFEHIISGAETGFGRENVFILTKPAPTLGCAVGKARWVDKHLPPGYTTRLLFADQAHGKKVHSRPGRVLVDDQDGHINGWREAGGTGILVPQPWNSMAHCHDQAGSIVFGCLLEPWARPD